jgi:hypothetical protein
VNKVKAMFEEFGTSTATVIVVETKVFSKDKKTKELYVVDGQHRLQGAIESGLPINIQIISLEVDTKLNFTRFMSMLNCGKSWSNDSYLNAYVKNDIEEYKTFALYKKQYKLTMTDLMHIFLGGAGEKENKLFRSGEMKFKNEKQSLELLKMLNEVRNLIPNKAYIRRAFYSFVRENKENKLIKDAMLTYLDRKYSENEMLFKGELKGLLLKYNRHLVMVAN